MTENFAMGDKDHSFQTCGIKRQWKLRISTLLCFNYNCALDLLGNYTKITKSPEREVQRFLTLRIHCWGLKNERHSFKNLYFQLLSWKKKWKNCQWWLHIFPHGVIWRGDILRTDALCAKACSPSSPLPNTSQRFIYGFASDLFFFCLVPISIYVWGHNFCRLYSSHCVPCSLWFICDYSNINLHLHVQCVLPVMLDSVRPP